MLVYEIKNNDKDSILTLAPIMNLRDFHTVTANYEFDLRQNINKKTSGRVYLYGEKTYTWNFGKPEKKCKY